MNINIKKIIFIISIFLSAITLFAREVTITVTDADLNIPLEGATIRTRDSGNFVCNRHGRAIITVPDDRPVVIQATYPGYETGVLTIPLTGNNFTIALHLSGQMMGRELVIEASRPGSSETRTGRSVAVTAREIAQTGEIGIIEDVMSTISLLPGVSYKGFLNAEPSIRGGHPGDMSASLNGFYINNPFFWGGTFSIFDPRMVQSAQLSHGVFSVRHGHTISGLLEVTSRNPSPTETQFELGASTSAANFNLSLPLLGKGGLLFMGRITYYDPVLALAGVLSEYIPELEVVSSFGPVPYIRVLSVNGNYRFTDKLELSATGFFGMDGVGVNFDNSSIVDGFLNSETTIDFLFVNYQTFFTSTLAWNPRNDMLIKFLVGTGYEEQKNLGDMKFDIHRTFSPNGFISYPEYDKFIKTGLIDLNKGYSFIDKNFMEQTESNLNLQGRIDYDWELSEKLIFSAGLQTMYNHFTIKGEQSTSIELNLANHPFLKLNEEINKISTSSSLADELLYISMPITYYPDSKNNLLSTSGYILGEYSPGNRLNVELGLRIDHFLLTGENDLRMDSDPSLNPRLHMDYNLLDSNGFFQKIDISLGTGLFSSINDNVFSAEEGYKIDKIRPNRSWTSVLGFKFEFPEAINFNIEGYYKYVFDRMYVVLEPSIGEFDIMPKFNGEGIVWGLDVMLQKIQSRFWDGWLSYSYSWAQYRDPDGNMNARGISGGNRGDDWYYPSFHRFHTLNLVLNYKPIQSMNLYMRLGFASGVPLSKRIGTSPQSYPVYLYNEGMFIEKYKWASYYDEESRTTPSINLDLKYSIFGAYNSGKTKYEVYVAVENVLGLLYTAQGNTSFNQYTGELDTGSFSATYDIPIPIPSFGFKITY